MHGRCREVVSLHTKGSHVTHAVWHQTTAVHSGIARTFPHMTQPIFTSRVMRLWQSGLAWPPIIRTPHDLPRAVHVVDGPRAHDVLQHAHHGASPLRGCSIVSTFVTSWARGPSTT